MVTHKLYLTDFFTLFQDDFKHIIDNVERHNVIEFIYKYADSNDLMINESWPQKWRYFRTRYDLLCEYGTLAECHDLTVFNYITQELPHLELHKINRGYLLYEY